MGWMLHRFQAVIQALMAQNEIHQKEQGGYENLTQQVHQLQEALGGMRNSLDTVGSQVDHLNALAGHALEYAQEGEDFQSELEGQSQMPHILIEIRPRQGDRAEGSQEHQVIDPEDLSPEMLEKFRAFRAVYQAILSQQTFPSRKRPDLN